MLNPTRIYSFLVAIDWNEASPPPPPLIPIIGSHKQTIVTLIHSQQYSAKHYQVCFTHTLTPKCSCSSVSRSRRACRNSTAWSITMFLCPTPSLSPSLEHTFSSLQLSSITGREWYKTCSSGEERAGVKLDTTWPQAFKSVPI